MDKVPIDLLSYQKKKDRVEFRKVKIGICLIDVEDNEVYEALEVTSNWTINQDAYEKMENAREEVIDIVFEELQRELTKEKLSELLAIESFQSED